MQPIDVLMFSACALGAIAVGMTIWVLSGGLINKFEKDVEWLEKTNQIFKPEKSGKERKQVLIAYCIHFLVVLPVLLVIFPSPVFGLGIWAIMLVIPKLIADQRKEARIKMIDSQLHDTILKFSILCGAGLSTADALRQLAEESEYPIKYEYRIMAREWELGADLTTITESAAQRLGLESFRLLAAAITVNNQLGGNLVVTLEKLSQSLLEQYEMRREIEAAMSEGKMSTYGLLMGPPVMLGIVSFLDFKAVEHFFHTVFGMTIFMVALAFILGGFFWAKSIANIKV